MSERTWQVGDRVTVARFLPDEPNVQRLNDPSDIGKTGVIAAVCDRSCYGHVAYKVIWDEPERPFGAIGLWCAAEQLDPAAPGEAGAISQSEGVEIHWTPRALIDRILAEDEDTE